MGHALQGLPHQVLLTKKDCKVEGRHHFIHPTSWRVSVRGLGEIQGSPTPMSTPWSPHLAPDSNILQWTGSGSKDVAFMEKSIEAAKANYH